MVIFDVVFRHVVFGVCNVQNNAGFDLCHGCTRRRTEEVHRLVQIDGMKDVGLLTLVNQ